MDKERLDILLVRNGLCESREKAKRLIMAGLVTINGEPADKAGSSYPAVARIELKKNPNPYVSRGGLKLDKAIRYFNIDLKGKTTMDVGASTGGFTDCMLKHEAVKVIAVDVGYGQLAWPLRNDGRVINMERTNIRYLKPEDIKTAIDFASIDVSFISLKKVLPVVYTLMNKEKGEVLCLVKPQFEAGRGKVGKRGVVRDMNIHRQVIEDIAAFAINTGYCFKGVTYSPIKGPEGNIEYFCYLSAIGSNVDFEEILTLIDKTVKRSHEKLNAKKSGG